VDGRCSGTTEEERLNAARNIELLCAQLHFSEVDTAKRLKRERFRAVAKSNGQVIPLPSPELGPVVIPTRDQTEAGNGFGSISTPSKGTAPHRTNGFVVAQAESRRRHLASCPKLFADCAPNAPRQVSEQCTAFPIQHVIC
jgi:hypothetical protein